MSLTISELRERIAAKFPEYEQLSESVIRFTRKAGDSPFAVCYVDITRELPKTQETLTNYQDHVIGPRYFEGRKSLQWSNYLYFVASRDQVASKDVRDSKELIERDRSYARKFVISEDELDSILNPPVVAPVDPSPAPTILSVWKDTLVRAGLDRAILSNDNLPARLAIVESPPKQSVIKPQIPVRPVQTAPPPFITSLHLKEYRRIPHQRKFDFGTVNLIFGPNGSGKTSLLEAIELFYCGRNKRNPHSSAAYELVATLSNGRTDRAKENRRFKLFRDRNMRWYRQPEVRTNNLYLTFAQFNFLDTDAAVGLALDKDSPTRIQNDLSKLLVGSEASKTWDDMERVFEAVASRLREVLPLRSQLNKELAGVVQRLNEAESVVHESDSIKVRLREMLGRQGWLVIDDGKEMFAGRVVESLSELMVVAQQASAIGWAKSPVTLESLNNYCNDTSVLIGTVEPEIARLEFLLNRVANLTNTNKNVSVALGIAKEASILIDRGIPRRLGQRDQDQRTIDSISEWLIGFDESFLTAFSDRDLEMSVVECYEAAGQQRTAIEGLLTKAKEEYSAFVNLRDQVVSLGQELRQIAQRIINKNNEPDECPLCHTRFKPGELQIHFNQGVDQHVEAVGQALLKAQSDTEGQLQEVSSLETASRWLLTFVEDADLEATLSVRSALSEAQAARRTLDETRKRVEALDNELLALEAEGLSGMKPDEYILRLQQFGYSIEELSRDYVDGAIARIENDLSNSVSTLEAERRQADLIRQRLALSLGGADFTAGEFTLHDAKVALSRLRERLSTTETLKSKLKTLTNSFPWAEDKPLAECALEAESARKVAGQLQLAIGREKQAETTHAESILRKSQLEQQLNNLAPRIARLTRAQATLQGLRRDHSITEAMKEALDHNRAGIELIFSRIHTPAEFSRLGSTWTTLIRKFDGSEAKLSEISTGQRAAFALAIFLAQNAQLTAAPPVILIDDPIAHVDDLNCLSFLDYLREIVLTGRRQIFFATADDKLGTLFERKFDFLGAQEFQRFDLQLENV